MRTILSKKAQVNSLAPAIIALLIAAIFLILGLIINQELRDADIVTQADSVTTLNETVSSVTEGGVDLATKGLQGANSFVVIYVANDSTTNTKIQPGNYTLSSDGTITFGSDSADDVLQFNNTDWDVSYSFSKGGEAWTGSNNTLTGLGTFADFWEIIILAIITTLVIGLLLGVFGGRKER